jgi:hypothetical protein
VIYQRRRIAALIVVLVVVALAIWAAVALRGGPSDNPDPEPAAVTTTEQTTSTTPTSASDSPTSSSPTSSAAPSSGEPTSTVAADAKKTCALSDLVITASTSKPTYAEGEEPVLYMTVHNPTAVECEIDLDEDSLRFEVYDLATNARVWSDIDCNPAVLTGTRAFPSGEDRYYEAIWSRTTSAPNQCTNRQPVPAGSFYVHTVIGDNPSQPQTFNLA